MADVIDSDSLESEVIHTRADAAYGMMPREKMARTRGVTEPRRPALWNANDVPDLAPSPVFGAYPKHFVPWACARIGTTPDRVLHVCSGMLTAEDGGMRVDIRQAARPTVRADGRQLPFRDGSVDGVLLDPPYSVEYAADLYGTDYPRPSHLMREAARVVRPGGGVGFLHFLVPFPVGGLEMVRTWGISQGCGYRIRAFCVYRKPQDNLRGIA